MRISGAVLILSAVIIVGLLITMQTSYRPTAKNLKWICNQMEVVEKLVHWEVGPYTISVEEYLHGPLAQDDDRIINYIKSNEYLRRPSPKHIPYNLTTPNQDPSMGQSQIIKKIFDGKRNGFFVECGALDGETRSNTLSLERDLGWEGLLVEGDPKNYNILLTKNRKAWSINCCLAIHPYPHEVIFKQNFNVGKIKSDDVQGKSGINGDSTATVQCFPFFTLLTALGIQTIDYFSLDIEGFEMDALKTIPFDSIRIKVLSVEFVHGKDGASGLINFMSQKGYKFVTKLTNAGSLANDIIFAHESFPITQEFPSVIRSETLSHNL